MGDGAREGYLDCSALGRGGIDVGEIYKGIGPKGGVSA